MNISILHLFWIVPISFGLGFLTLAIMSVGAYHSGYHQGRYHGYEEGFNSGLDQVQKIS